MLTALRLLPLATLAFSAVLPAAVQPLAPASLFSDGVVLQRDLPVAVWGHAAPGEIVTVEFAGQSVSALTAPDHRWLARLAPLAASSTPRTLRIRASTTVEIRDVLVGEVWLASGQSNMQRRLGPATSDQASARGLELAGPDEVFHPATATLHDDRLFLSSPAVPAVTFIRHGWAHVPDTNLVNLSGLPAGPFQISL